jgi:hypothetical protein
MLTAGHILDMYDDAFGVHLSDGELLEKYGNVRIDRAQDLRGLPDKDFALVIFTKTGERLRKYPMHTPDALAISAYYFEKMGAQLTPEARAIVATNLELAHHRFGAIAPEELRKLASEKVIGNMWPEGRRDEPMVQEEIPAARTSEKYALRREMADESIVEMFPIDTLDDCRASACELRKVAYELPAFDRYRAAQALSEQLVKLGHPDHEIEQLASLEPNPAFMAHIAARMEILKDDESKKTLSTLSKLSGVLKGVKLAEALEVFDKKAGIAYHWDRRIRNPFDSCFQAKEASIKVGDAAVTGKDLVRLIDSGKLASMFKTSTLKDFRAQPLEVFQSLPDPVKKEIAQLL